MIRSNKGFSLIELMVVVAIIGILATIAVPSVNKYMAKARQSEAKSNLASIYTANKAFYAEFNIYDSRFTVIGYSPEGKLRYNMGFPAGGQCTLLSAGYTTVPTITSTDALTYCGANGVFANGCTVLQDGQGANGVLPATAALACVAAGTSTFTAGASGRISSNAPQVDQWTMTQNKELTNTQDGT